MFEGMRFIKASDVLQKGCYCRVDASKGVFVLNSQARDFIGGKSVIMVSDDGKAFAIVKNDDGAKVPTSIASVRALGIKKNAKFKLTEHQGMLCAMVGDAIYKQPTPTNGE